MRETIAIIFLTFVLSIGNKSHAYDFTALTSQGQCLYYSIIGTNAVEVSSPGNDAGWLYVNTRPTGSLVIPSHVIYQTDTFEVISIGHHAFEYCDGLTSITIPNTVRYVGMWAFWGCSLITINFPSTPVYLETHSFHGTTWYNNQPSGLVYLGNTLYKYKGWSNLTEDYSITIPANTNSIAGGAFSTDGGFYGPDTGYNRHLISVVIPNSVKYIGTNAFWFCGLTNIILPDSLELIGNGAFYNNPLPEVTIPRSVKVIGGVAFGNNDSLRRINLLAEHLEDSSIHLYSTQPFSGCSNIQKINIGNTVTHITTYLFSECNGFDTIIIPNSVRTIGTGAFANCSGIKSITIGEGLDSIGSSVFPHNSPLEELNYYATNCRSSFGFYNTSSFHLTIGENVTSIPQMFLQGCTNYCETVVLPESVRYIGSWAFCSTGINGELTIPSNVDTIGVYTFLSTNITGIRCKATNPPHLAGFIKGFYIPLFVPCNSVSAYQAANVWGNYQSIEGFGCNVTITASSNNPAAGYVEGGGTYNYGDNATLTAVANTGFRFDHWQDGNTNNPRTITVTADATHVAYFTPNAGIDDIDNSGIKVYAKDYQIYIDEAIDEEVTVYSIDGRIIASLPKATERVAIPVTNTGVYIVKIDNHPARKVVVMQ